MKELMRIVRITQYIQTSINRDTTQMHYRNGRAAKNGDKIVQLQGGKVTSFGVLYDATHGNDYCNGSIAVIQQANVCACMCDCLHVDDLAALLGTAGLDKRLDGK